MACITIIPSTTAPSLRTTVTSIAISLSFPITVQVPNGPMVIHYNYEYQNLKHPTLRYIDIWGVVSPNPTP